jgi:hypothetical protein
LSILNNSLPKTIWFLWLQGMDKAPVEVKACYNSWVQHNPGWQVVFLDESNIAEHVTLPKWEIAKYVASELLRINLLADHGGVWTDATCFCMRPLDEWLYDNMDAGFFAFDRPGPDRMLSSWFLAAAKNNYIASAYQKKVNDFWKENTGIKLIENTRWNFLYKRLQKSNPQIWFNPFLTRVLKVHPYFWLHYTFENIYLSDAAFRRQWDAVPKISADIPHRLLFAGLLNSITDEIKKEIKEKISPVYKLTWKYDAAGYKPGTIMYYLFHHENVVD